MVCTNFYAIVVNIFEYNDCLAFECGCVNCELDIDCTLCNKLMNNVAIMILRINDSVSLLAACYECDRLCLALVVNTLTRSQLNDTCVITVFVLEVNAACKCISATCNKIIVRYCINKYVIFLYGTFLILCILRISLCADFRNVNSLLAILNIIMNSNCSAIRASHRLHTRINRSRFVRSFNNRCEARITINTQRLVAYERLTFAASEISCKFNNRRCILITCCKSCVNLISSLIRILSLNINRLLSINVDELCLDRVRSAWSEI